MNVSVVCVVRQFKFQQSIYIYRSNSCIQLFLCLFNLFVYSLICVCNQFAYYLYVTAYLNHLYGCIHTLECSSRKIGHLVYGSRIVKNHGEVGKKMKGIFLFCKDCKLRQMT